MAGRSPTIETMQELAERTGGVASYNRNDVDVAMSESIEAQRLSYTLGFYLTAADRDGSFHRLKVSVNRPHVTLQNRLGYMSEPGEDKTRQSVIPVKKREPLEALLLNPADSNAIGISARRGPVLPGTPRPTLELSLALDLHTLSLHPDGGQSAGRVEEMFLELDDSGAVIARVRDTRDFRIPPSSLEHLYQIGLNWPRKIDLQPGATRVRILVRDEASGRSGSLTVPLERF